jgi:hypothetical protein
MTEATRPITEVAAGILLDAEKGQAANATAKKARVINSNTCKGATCTRVQQQTKHAIQQGFIN